MVATKSTHCSTVSCSHQCAQVATIATARHCCNMKRSTTVQGWMKIDLNTISDKICYLCGSDKHVSSDCPLYA
ncbi:hypothetical protein BX666DRAFT_1959678 [Dichotomocladium elegans]|nr:hypothetical protein BX666DRAFT_1959678 [Dichotomocladium elegans]